MTWIERIRAEYVEFIPRQLQPGVLYVSQTYSMASHLCCCGCGREVVTPLSPADWQVELGAAGVSLRPSVGNWGLPCRSHYWIKGGSVHCSRVFNEVEIAAVRRRDLAATRQHIEDRNRARHHPVRDWVMRACRALISWAKDLWK